ncbi:MULTISPECIES: nitrogen regulation protein NR(I) [unclassified Wenzhouxiangella]|uniref:nitrogen regulation protein NR(I) n=1 Tax=unclassified Wenzhouxiangella TaxID=2613841 RepID=UPI000E325DCA|nr:MULTISPECIES: nitrogen regulation protein NR(I) [unclassified Wenzhouxiangella]RFF27150.1 nitrogen regulation protein NR(I) [Wenzhouxiangella sp. 15181]RFP69163.1 nitrogen regulation protein NR(I) [Wenzhouxiangella sp. 15190]
MTERIWIIDDDPAIRYVLAEYFDSQNMQARSFADGASLTAALDEDAPDLVMADVRLDGESGLDVMQRLRERHPDLPVIVMTAYSDLDSAVRAFRGGAFEFLAKPFDLDEVGRLVSKALRRAPEPRETSAGDTELIGSSPAFQHLVRMIGRLSASDVPVLITGETGTGKELVARALHRHSPRAERSFVAINTAAIPEDLLESELFGHEKGAFTGAEGRRPGRFEQAEGGTLFLDEIGDMPLKLQTRLLRVLAEGEYYRLGGHDLIRADVRVITATHRDLSELVRKGRFRADLYHRLKVIELKVPSLRERREDIPALASHFLQEAAAEFNLPERSADQALIRHLAALPWPGNVRELRHLCQSLAALAPGEVIGTDDLPEEYRHVQCGTDTESPGWTRQMEMALRQRLAGEENDLHGQFQAQFEASLAHTAVAACDGNQSEAARRLGISRNTLARMLKEV